MTTLFATLVLHALALGAFAGCQRGGGIQAEATAVLPPVAPERPAVPPSLCADVDERDLKAVTACFYQKGRPWSPRGTWSLLSKNGQKDAGAVERWESPNKKDDPPCVTTEVEILGDEDRMGVTFARVSKSMRCPRAGREGECLRISTNTWVREDGKWRILRFPVAEEIESAKFKSGDYEAAAHAAESLLEMDPFSIGAYTDLLWCLNRIIDDDRHISERQRQIVRAVLAINDNDTMALHDAISFTKYLNISKSFLRRMPIEACYRPGAVANIANLIDDPAQRLQFLDQNSVPGAPEIALRKIRALKQLGRKDRIIKEMDAIGEEGFRLDLDREDATYAANWSSDLGEALLLAGAKDRARYWLDYGLSRDPNVKDLRDLERKLNP